MTTGSRGVSTATTPAEYFLVVACLFAALTASAQEFFDVVVLNGRVIDPESGLDGVRSLGIRGRRIEAITIGPLQGKETIDATNLVVAPGFIDLHMHWQVPRSWDFLALDGVTTALELEGGAYPIDPWYAALRVPKILTKSFPEILTTCR